MIITFQVREDDYSNPTKVLVDQIVNLEVKAPLIFLLLLLKIVPPQKLGGFVDGIADLKRMIQGALYDPLSCMHVTR